MNHKIERDILVFYNDFSVQVKFCIERACWSTERNKIIFFSLPILFGEKHGEFSDIYYEYLENSRHFCGNY